MIPPVSMGHKRSHIFEVSGFGAYLVVYHELGNHEREWEIYEMGLRAIPDERRIIYQQAICALSQRDTAEANRLIEHH